MRQDNARTLEALVQFTNRTAQPMGKLQAKLKVSALVLQEVLDYAKDRGYEVRVRDGYVFSRVANRQAKRVVLGSTKPGRYRVGYWSDTHFGCRHSDEDGMVEHITRCYADGARVMVHTGDLLDGNRPVLLGDQDHVGFDSQLNRLVKVLKKAPPMEYVAIDGNHDGYYSSAISSPSGAIVASRLREEGFKWTFAGVCEGRAEIHGADWYLWHPHGGSQSKLGVTGVLANKVQDLDEHVDVFVMGHLHKFVASMCMGTLTVCPGTYQRKMSEFANRISGPWDIGGVIVSYDLGKDGKIREMAADWHPSKAK